MVQYLAGDESAFEVVYRRRRDGLRRFLARQCSSQAIAQELAQEAWFKVIRATKNGSYTADGKFTTYLYRVGRNTLIDWYRKNGTAIEVEIDESVNEEVDVTVEETWQIRNPEESFADQERSAAVLAGIAELPELQRMTLLMHLESDMSYEDIAAATGTNRETVKSRLRYARRFLKQRVFGD
jgi:RNA polymerase sigma-70 factor (ECF subfamily)